ncbi:MAG TPA: SDR family oxidoreductase [Opitutaceae bacterium]|nr:SDR family oxidoreductase [Opitutaceae bacterium]
MEASATGNTPSQGPTAVISGGLGDIGRAIAIALRAAGARVALSDLAPAKTAAQRMPSFHYTRVDIADYQQVKTWLQAVERSLSVPTWIICNAGVVIPGSSRATSPALWEKTLSVNLTGSFFLAQLAAERMAKKKLPGRIVFIGSWAGEVPHPQITAYSVAKAGLRMAMKCLATDYAAYGILVNEVAPGIVDAGLSGKMMARTPHLREKTRQRIPVRRMLTPEDVAQGVVSLCDSRNLHMTGSVLLLDGGLTLKGPLPSSNADAD